MADPIAMAEADPLAALAGQVEIVVQVAADPLLIVVAQVAKLVDLGSSIVFVAQPVLGLEPDLVVVTPADRKLSVLAEIVPYQSGMSAEYLEWRFAQSVDQFATVVVVVLEESVCTHV